MCMCMCVYQSSSNEQFPAVVALDLPQVLLVLLVDCALLHDLHPAPGLPLMQNLLHQHLVLLLYLLLLLLAGVGDVGQEWGVGQVGVPSVVDLDHSPNQVLVFGCSVVEQLLHVGLRPSHLLLSPPLCSLGGQARLFGVCDVVQTGLVPFVLGPLDAGEYGVDEDVPAAHATVFHICLFA